MKNMLFILDIENMDFETTYRKYSSYIKEDRRSKINRFKAEIPKLHSLGAGIAFRQSLLELGYSDFDIDNMNISYDSCGKPYFSNINDLFFNISHSGNYVIISWSKNNIGCDVEEIDNKNCLDIAKRFFTENEYNILIKINDYNERQRMFYRLWTLKEAYIKHDGRGMGIELNSFDIPLNINQSTGQYFVNDVYLKEYYINEKYCISAASALNDFEDTLISLKI